MDPIKRTIDAIHDEIVEIGHEFGCRVPPVRTRLVIYGTRELERKLRDIPDYVGPAVLEQDPSGKKLLGLPFFPILEEGVAKPFRVVIAAGGTG